MTAPTWEKERGWLSNQRFKVSGNAYGGRSHIGLSIASDDAIENAVRVSSDGMRGYQDLLTAHHPLGRYGQVQIGGACS
jgi:hypothetical protein